jgi:DpnII restriction endonuclease
MPKKQINKPDTPPSISAEQAIPLIKRQIERLEEIKSLSYDDPKVDGWTSSTTTVLNNIFGQPNGELEARTKDFKYAHGGPIRLNMSKVEVQKNHVTRCENRKALLEAYMEQLQDFSIPPSTGKNIPLNVIAAPIERLNKIFDRFHKIARQLRIRHQNRPTLNVDDEYDVQDLMHALLCLDFNDIRPEEYTPSYAGGNSRMDFLLKDEKVVIEIKKTRHGLGAREIGEELSIDITRYRGHPDCDTLICFVYDPEGKIGNPSGLRNDLEKLSSSELRIIVVIRPL